MIKYIELLMSENFLLAIAVAIIGAGLTFNACATVKILNFYTDLSEKVQRIENELRQQKIEAHLAYTRRSAGLN